MNERIEELAEQCGIIGGDLYENRVVDYEKFAELIIKESARFISILDSEPMSHLSASYLLLEHFGVDYV